MIDQITGTIIATQFASGKTTDFRLLQASKLCLSDTLPCYADLGYQGWRKSFSGASLPTKKPAHGQLTQEQKRANKEQRRQRIVVEHTIRRLKVFKICPCASTRGNGWQSSEAIPFALQSPRRLAQQGLA